MIRDRFTAGEAARLSGINYRTLDYWDKTSFIVPSVSKAEGKGSRRFYSFTDLVALRSARLLRAAGVPLQSLRVVVERVRQMDVASPLSEMRLIVAGGDVFFLDGDQPISAMKRPGQIAFAFVVFAIGEVVGELKDSVADLPALSDLGEAV